MLERDRIVTLAHSHGFQHVRFAGLSPTPHFEAFAQWIHQKQHGCMSYLEKNADVRGDPKLRLDGAQTAMVLAMEYDHARPQDPGGLTGKVAAYAWGRDYHNLIGKRLRKLRKTLREEGIHSWGGVDTAPILERSWATAAALGFNGKNSVQILPAHGSFMFLAVLFLDVAIPGERTLGDHCGSCTRCLDICPTEAFGGPRQLDARLCIAYWTIEDRGPIPLELRPKFGRWFFGCDDCQTICPHNVDPPHSAEEDFRPRNAWVDLVEVLETSPEALMKRFIGTPLRRPGSDGLKRNACVVMGNLGQTEAIPFLRKAADGESDLVSEHAQWALGRLGG
jgi:epoxyqueuosine reductase